MESRLGAQTAADERLGALQQPRHGVGEVLLRWRTGQVALHVFDGAFEDVQLVVQLVEFAARDDEFRLAQPELGGPLTSFEVPLAAGLPAVPPRAPRARSRGDGPAAPPAADALAQ